MSKVVFVGNVPYTMTEAQLTDVFKSVGEVVGFRLVYDRDTAKPKGYGFCEFADHETAASAVRNLNNVDVGGRSLRIDLADSDPLLEGKTTFRGEIIDGGGGGGGSGVATNDSRYRDTRDHRDYSRDNSNKDRLTADVPRKHASFLADMPKGLSVPLGSTALDMISQTLATMPQSQLMEVLAQMKAFVYTHPDEARALFIRHPQLAYALFQALLLNNIVDRALLQRMQASITPSNPPQQQQQAPPPPPTGPSYLLHHPPQPAPYPNAGTPVPPPPMTMHHPSLSVASYPGMSAPPPPQAPSSHYSSIPSMPPQNPYGMPLQQQPTPSYMQPPQQSMRPLPTGPSANQQQQQQSATNEEQARMIQQVLSLSQADLNGLPPEQREIIEKLRATVQASAK